MTCERKSTMNSKRLQTAVLIGCLLGVTVPFGAMALSHRPTHAAIAVFDERNIAEAVKTAITTAKILTAEQQELALKLLDAKKLDKNILADLFQKQMNASKTMQDGNFCKTPDVLKDLGLSPGILNQHTTVQSVLMDEIGTIESVLDEKATLVDLYHETVKNHKILDATYQDAAKTAQNAQRSGETLNQGVQQAVEASNNAEGEQQLLQSSIQIAAANYYMNRNTNELLANLLAMQAEEAYVANRERAIIERREEEHKANLKKFVGE